MKKVSKRNSKHISIRQSQRKCRAPKLYILDEAAEEIEIPVKRNVRNKKKSKRNSEKRKEKSRDAARSRRGKESEIFSELAQTLPLSASAVSQLDKASIMRLCIAFLRTRDLINRGLHIVKEDIEENEPPMKEELEPNPDSLLMKALDGFLLVLTREGDIVYSSDNISKFLGLSQIDTMGQSVMDYAHPCDHEELRTLVTSKGDTIRHAFIRMKCTISNKGRNVNLKSASYKVVQMCGKIVDLCGTEMESDKEGWVVVMGIPVPHPSNIDIPLDTQTFVSKHSLDMKFTYVDDNVERFCKYSPEDLLGRSIYDIPHALDSNLLRTAFKTLLVKGQVETSRYRLLARGGGYVWTVTQATLISGSKDNKPEYVVCLNYVISEILQPTLLVSEVQLVGKHKKSCDFSRLVEDTISLPNSSSVSPSKPKIIAKPFAGFPKCQSMPIASTSSLLREKPKDMDSGFLTFISNDPDATVLKEELEDLTHLAPSGGDNCLPLDIPHLLNQELDELFKTEPISAYNQVVDLLRFENTEPSLSESSFKKSHNDRTSVAPASATQSCLKPSRRIDLVPEVAQSPCSATGSPSVRFDTPEPPSPQSPLLSQATLPQSTIKTNSYLGQKPLGQGSSDAFEPTSSTMDLFSGYNMKWEEPNFDNEEFDFRAPYISPMDMLVFGPEDNFMPTQDQPINHNQQLEPENVSEEIDFDDVERAKNCYYKKNCPLLRSNSPLQNPKISGSSCVDPNQVLAVQFTVQGESEGNSGELRHLLEQPIATLCSTDASSSPPLESSLKRSMSPPSSPAMKRVRALSMNESRPMPMMQQLLVSKDAVSVQRHVVSASNTTGDRNGGHEQGHSVLRNLLTSGRDDIAGYTIYVSGLSADGQQNSATSNVNNVKAEGNTFSLESLASLPVNRDGKVELTKQQLSTLLGSAGLRLSLNDEVQQKQKSKLIDQFLVLNGDDIQQNVAYGTNV